MIVLFAGISVQERAQTWSNGTVFLMPKDSLSAVTFPLNLDPLVGTALEAARLCLDSAAQAALRATCLRSRCGSVVVEGSRLLGAGWNSLPGDEVPQVCWKEEGCLSAAFKSDRTCCVHAEVRALTNALRAGNDVSGATLYFTRVDDKGQRVASGAPYCTICSKFALESGVSYFVLEHDFGVVAYPSEVYNQLSFSYQG